jgi:arylsulfatase A-like enzyme
MPHFQIDKPRAAQRRVMQPLRLLLLCVTALSIIQAQAAQKPNVIIILADDLGYADIGVNGCNDIPTPHIDQIAKNGVRFTAGYANHPVCAPSRAGLISGMYQHRFGFENNSGLERAAAPNFGLPHNVPTIAERLKSAGYATGLIGKWHVGFKEGMRPNDRGFDYFYGFLGGARSFDPQESQDTAPIMRNGEIVNDETEYLTDAFGREAVDFIQNSSQATTATATQTSESAQPYFLYLSFSAVHLPLEVPPAYEERFPNITDPKRKPYAGMLAAMDDAVGDVMAKVRELGQEENTMVFFYSDNGGPTAHTTSSNGPLRGSKGSVYEGGIRVPFVMQWRGSVPAGQTYDEPVIGFDCHGTAVAAAGIEGENLDGKNLLPYLTGEETTAPHPYLCWRSGSQKAIRMGDWKLVSRKSGDEVQLFNLKADIREKEDLSSREPGKLKELEKQLAEWEKGTVPPAWERQLKED